jgi:anti-sigma28 factor (negative regulator of flagellin synthesis)
MDELRRMEVESLRERVVRSQYEVDTSAVARAILARLLAARPATADPGR